MKGDTWEEEEYKKTWMNNAHHADFVRNSNRSIEDAIRTLVEGKEHGNEAIGPLFCILIGEILRLTRRIEKLESKNG